ncbi:MAG: hypothetical protein ACI35S_05770 [Anaeroplasma sp.]
MKFLESKSKLIFIIYGVLFGLVLVMGLYFMTQYANIHIFYVDNKGVPASFAETNGITIGGSSLTNQYLFDYFKYSSNTFGYGEVDYDLGMKIFNFQSTMSQFNDLIITFVVVGLIGIALFVIFSNHNRKVYYISNLVVGIVVSLTMIVFSIVMIVKNLGLMSNFTENEEFYKVISIMMDSNLEGSIKDLIIDGNIAFDDALSQYASNVTSSTFIVATICFAIVAVYSLFILVYTVLRYKGSTKRRNEIIERAAQNND